jgi:hypothetical protein
MAIMACRLNSLAASIQVCSGAKPARRATAA